jgi:prepilin-type N-terminal cleavage/methylation domain-containing protein
MKNDKWRVTSGEKMMSSRRQVMRRGKSHHSSLITHHSGFTLIELLVVISIIGVLAALTLSALKSVKRHQYISHTQAEMGLLETAIQRYHDAYGFYPPSNPNYPADPSQSMFSPLYFELLGTTSNNGNYQTLDGSASISASTMTSGFGVGGFINCTKGSGDDAHSAQNFLPGLKPKQFGLNITNTYKSVSVPVALLLGSVGGPDQNYQPLNAPNVNPWRYASPGTNNPNSYDLWIQLVISGQTNLVCNWSKQVQINSPLP